MKILDATDILEEKIKHGIIVDQDDFLDVLKMSHGALKTIEYNSRHNDIFRELKKALEKA